MSFWRDPLWRKAPLALVRFPAVLAGVVAGAALLALAAASNPFFISASASAALTSEIERVTAFGAGATIAVSDIPSRGGHPTWEPRDAALDRELRGVDGLGERVTTVLGPDIAAEGPGGSAGTLELRLLARTGALEQVRKLDDAGGTGAWLAHTAAEALGVRPGDEIRLGLDTTPRTASVRVRGIYRALKLEPPTPYWRSLGQDIYPKPPDYAEPATFALVDEQTAAALASELGIEFFFFRWEYPLTDASLTVPEAEALARHLERLQRRLLTPDTSLQAAFACPRRNCYFFPTEYSSQLPTAVRNARETAATVRGPVDLLSNAGSLVALAVVAAAAGFALARRRVEIALLFSRGESPGRLGARIALEAALPALVGTLLGLGLAFLLVELLGPGRVAAPALEDGAVAALIRLPAALVLVGLVAAFEFARRLGAESRRPRRLPSIPWELPVLALAGFFLAKLLSGDGFVEGAGGVSRPSFYLLLFPIAFIAGVAGLAARALLHAVAWWRARAMRSEAAYLASHRLAASGRLMILLVTASAVALGIFIYAQAVVSSYRATVHASSLLSTGSDVQGQVSFNRAAPSDVPFPVTKATRAYDVGIAEPGGTQIDLLAVDPATIEAAVHWEDGYADVPLGQITKELARAGDALPVVVLGARAEEVQAIRVEELRIPVRVVETAHAFPGMPRRGAVVVASTEALQDRFEGADVLNPLSGATYSEIWAKGDPAETARLLSASEARPFPVVTAEEARDRPEVTAFTRTFAFLEALGLAAGALAAVGMVLYLQVRQRGRVVSYGLARRMGLGAASHRRALVLELALALFAALVLGFGLALVAARLVVGEVEPLASISPVPLFNAPLLLALPTAAVLAAVAYAGAAAANRAAERASLSEVLRLGE